MGVIVKMKHFTATLHVHLFTHTIIHWWHWQRLPCRLCHQELYSASHPKCPMLAEYFHAQFIGSGIHTSTYKHIKQPLGAIRGSVSYPRALWRAHKHCHSQHMSTASLVCWKHLMQLLAAWDASIYSYWEESFDCGSLRWRNSTILNSVLLFWIHRVVLPLIYIKYISSNLPSDYLRWLLLYKTFFFYL